MGLLAGFEVPGGRTLLCEVRFEVEGIKREDLIKRNGSHRRPASLFF